MKHRAAIVVVAFIGSVIACTRSAEQTNFLGKACSGAADCPADLLCVANACWEPCGAGGTCPTGKVCTFNACVPGASVDGGGGGGGERDAGVVGTVDPDDHPNGESDSGGGSTDPREGGKVEEPDTGTNGGNPDTDGRLVLSGLSQATFSHALVLDDTNLVYVKKSTNALGEPSADIVARPLAGGAEVTVATIDGNEASLLENNDLHVAAGSVFRLVGNAPQSITRYDIADQSATPIPGDVRQIVGVIGTRLVFIDQQENLRLYDAAAKSLDATLYGSLQNLTRSIAIQGTELTWLTQALGGDGKFHVMHATLGSPGTDLGRTFPSTAMVKGMVVTGNAGAMLLGDAPTSIYTFDPATNTAIVPGSALGSIDDNSTLSGDGKLYVFVRHDDAPGLDLVSIDATGTKTKLGKLANGGGAAATATTIYALDPSGNGSSLNLYKWAKP